MSHIIKSDDKSIINFLKSKMVVCNHMNQNHVAMVVSAVEQRQFQG